MAWIVVANGYSSGLSIAKFAKVGGPRLYRLRCRGSYGVFIIIWLMVWNMAWLIMVNEISGWWFGTYFPTCQVRVVRFYLSCLLLLLLSSSSRRPPPLVVLLLSLSSSSRCPPRPPAQLRLAIHSVRCGTSTTTIHAQCSLPDLNHDHPRPVFPAGPQPRPSTPSVPCWTSTASIHAKRYAT